MMDNKSYDNDRKENDKDGKTFEPSRHENNSKERLRKGRNTPESSMSDGKDCYSKIDK